MVYLVGLNRQKKKPAIRYCNNRLCIVLSLFLQLYIEITDRYFDRLNISTTSSPAKTTIDLYIDIM